MNTDIVINTVSFIFLAPLVGMLMAFIISLWFLFSFRKDILPRIISLLFIVGILFFLKGFITTSPTDITGMKTAAHNNTFVISDVANKSAAQRMGFKKEDTLLAINGQPIADKKALDEVLKTTGQNNSFSYTVQRKGKVVNGATPYLTNYTSRFNQVLLYGQNFKWFILG